MKTDIVFALLLALCSIASCQEYVAEMKKYVVICLKEASVDDKEFEKLMKEELKLEDATENLKCVTKCLMEKIGFFTAAGEFRVDGFKAKPGSGTMPDAGNRAIEACNSIKDNNPCDMAFKILRCLTKNNH